MSERFTEGRTHDHSRSNDFVLSISLSAGREFDADAFHDPEGASRAWYSLYNFVTHVSKIDIDRNAGKMTALTVIPATVGDRRTPYLGLVGEYDNKRRPQTIDDLDETTLRPILKSLLLEIETYGGLKDHFAFRIVKDPEWTGDREWSDLVPLPTELSEYIAELMTAYYMSFTNESLMRRRRYSG